MVLPRFSAVLTHVISWLLFFSLIISFDTLASHDPVTASSFFSGHYLIFYGTYLLIFYVNYHVLVPRLYLRRLFGLYVAVIGLLLLGVYLTQPFDHIYSQGGPAFSNRPPAGGGSMPPPAGGGQERMLPPPPNNRQQHIDIVSIVLFFMIWSLSTAIRIIRQWRMTEQRAAQAEAGKAQAELSFLKAQINPHFLFNTLNNIYSLSVTGSPQTSDAILKLSNIMRYMTDEVTQNFVPLESEIACTGDYIDLQRLRLNNQASINYSVVGDGAGKKIAPLLIMTFVENVFKYGVSSHQPSEIIIKLFVGKQSLEFFSQNQVFPANYKEDRTGIGIANTRKRLEHLYPDKYLLNIISRDNLFAVHLSLML